ncbi:hypothetical protein RN001_005814 [Aquatica leii]|uniref:SWIM-type domain-containing protein n=1 Tax=Aquatica leii TaxID=1421715 RepID=A0AAN7SS49_9COLE|nr:hypothetical protein RN001_005814 [Aquatica leii]
MAIKRVQYTISSHIGRPPHTIKIKLHSDAPKEWTCICSCKAGAGGKCKHIIACLIFAYRNDLEPLSCTDIEQKWGQTKTHSVTDKTQPIQEFCHVKKRELPNDVDEGFLQSTIAKLLCGKKSKNSDVS